MSIKDAKAATEMHSVVVEARNESIKFNLELYKSFCAFYSSINFVLFLQGNNFLFYLYFFI